MRFFPWVAVACLAACGGEQRHETVAPARESGELVVLTVQGPTTWFADAAGNPVGLEHDLVQRLADALQLRLRLVFVTSETELIPALEARRGHLAAGLPVPSAAAEARVRLGPAYQTVTQQLIWRADRPRPAGVTDLRGMRIAVLPDSRAVDLLAQAKTRTPGLTWEEIAHSGPDDLLKLVADGRYDATVIDSHWFTAARKFYGGLAVAFELGKPAPLAWAFPQAGDEFVYRAAREFFARARKDGSLAQLVERYHSNLRPLDRNDIDTFLARRESLLPRWRPLFVEAQLATGIDWRMIAALAYQESHWEPAATSPTGVRGMMMLTEETAARLGVKNRLDPREDVPAGARYLVLLRDALPPHIPEPDRTWMAVAAYNLGQGSLESARLLAQRQKLNPDSWSDLKKALPLLASAEHSASVPTGFARGGEALAMAENVRQYFDILVRFERGYETSPPAATQ